MWTTLTPEGEAERIRRVPGIIFVDGATGRRARVAGRGLEVFEVIMPYLGGDRDFDYLRERFSWCLSDDQLRAAVTYYEIYPVEIDAVIEEADRAYRDFLNMSTLFGPGVTA